MDMIILSRGRIYREKDLHVEAPNGRIAILSPVCSPNKGVDVIEAGRCQQRKSQPTRFGSILEALNEVSGEHYPKLGFYRLLTLEGHRVRIA